MYIHKYGVVTAGAQDELMQSLDYKLKTSNTSYVTARHDVQYFPSLLSFFSPTTSRVCRIPLTSGTSFIDPESIKIAFRVRNTDGTNSLAPATPNACFVQRVQVLDSALVESFNRALLSRRSLVFSYPTVHTQWRLHETHGRVCDLLEQRRGLQDPLAGHPGQDVAPIGAARQTCPPQMQRADAAEWR